MARKTPSSCRDVNLVSGIGVVADTGLNGTKTKACIEQAFVEFRHLNFRGN
jgi:hypothetical protein